MYDIFGHASAAHVGHTGPVRELPPDLAENLFRAANRLGPSFDAVRVDEIVDASGIPRATLYYYFSGKDDILGFLIRESLNRLVEQTSRAAEGTADAASRLMEVIRSQLQHMRDNPGTSRLLFSSLGHVGELPAIASRIDAGFHEPVRKLLHEGALDGSLRRLEDLDLASSALFGSVTAVGLRCLVVDERTDVDTVLSALVPMFWRGLEP